MKSVLTEENKLLREENELLREKTTEMELEKQKLLQELEETRQLAKRDPLTGLLNRRTLDDMEEIDEGSTVVMIDLDRFKQVNDTYGHQTGDQILVLMAKIIIGNTRFRDKSFRYGGDEFLIIFDSCELELVEMRCQNIALDYQSASRGIIGEEATSSFGKCYVEPGMSKTDVIAKADKQLYDEKTKRHSK